MFVWNEICFVHHMRLDCRHWAQRTMFGLIAVAVLLFVPCSVAQSTTPSWDTKPSDQVQGLGLNVSLDCAAYNLNGKTMVWMKVQGPDATASLLFVNNDRFQADPRYGVTFAVQNVSTMLTLHLTSVQREDDAIYQCSIQGVLSAVASVTILGKLPFQLFITFLVFLLRLAK